jgi:hypothetical protein
MPTFISQVRIQGGFIAGGRGATQEEAERDCLQRVKQHLETSVVLVNHDTSRVTLPVHQMDRMPKELPEGCQLVIFERTPAGLHSKPNDWRFFALKPSTFTVEGREVEITDRTVCVHTQDAHANVTYPLPEGSMEYVKGEWVPSAAVVYNY